MQPHHNAHVLIWLRWQHWLSVQHHRQFAQLVWASEYQRELDSMNALKTVYPARARMVVWHCRKCGCLVHRLPHPERPAACGLCNSSANLIGSER